MKLKKPGNSTTFPQKQLQSFFYSPTIAEQAVSQKEKGWRHSTISRRKSWRLPGPQKEISHLKQPCLNVPAIALPCLHASQWQVYHWVSLGPAAKFCIHEDWEQQSGLPNAFVGLISLSTITHSQYHCCHSRLDEWHWEAICCRGNLIIPSRIFIPSPFASDYTGCRAEWKLHHHSAFKPKHCSCRLQENGSCKNTAPIKNGANKLQDCAPEFN